MAYRYTAPEVAKMKESILGHIANEDVLVNGEKTAWRLHCALSGAYLCCPGSKRKKARQARELALFESLTDSQHRPTFEFDHNDYNAMKCEYIRQQEAAGLLPG